MPACRQPGNRRPRIGCARIGTGQVLEAQGLPRYYEPQEDDLFGLAHTPALPGESKPAHLRRILDLWSGVLHPARSYETEVGVTFADFEAVRGRFWSVIIIPDVSDQATPGRAGSYSVALDAELRLFCDAVARAKEILYLYYLADTGMAGERYILTRFLEPVRHLLQFHRQPFEPPSSYPDPFSGPDPSSDLT